MNHFVSKTCEGEHCSVCGRPATHKVGEESYPDHPASHPDAITNAAELAVLASLPPWLVACGLDAAEREEFRAWLLQRGTNKAVAATAVHPDVVHPDVLRMLAKVRQLVLNVAAGLDPSAVAAIDGLDTLSDRITKYWPHTQPGTQALKAAWKRGVLEANDKLYAATVSGVDTTTGVPSLTMARIVELLNILLQNPPEFP